MIEVSRYIGYRYINTGRQTDKVVPPKSFLREVFLSPFTGEQIEPHQLLSLYKSVSLKGS